MGELWHLVIVCAWVAPADSVVTVGSASERGACDGACSDGAVRMSIDEMWSVAELDVSLSVAVVVKDCVSATV